MSTIHVYKTPEQRYDEKAKARLLAFREILPSGCWRFTGHCNKRNYGAIAYKGRPWPASRLSLKLFKPSEYIDYLNVLHTCNYTTCFNPDHLYSGTQSQNIIDCVKAGRHPEARKTHCPYGHEYTPENTYIGSRNGRNCIICRKLRDASRRVTIHPFYTHKKVC